MFDITEALHAVERGEAGAADRLLPLVYDELRRLAASRLAKEPPGHTLDATALVHEAYLRLGNQRFEHRGHFFAAAAEAMRRALIDSARRKRAAKNGGAMVRHAIDDVPVAGSTVMPHEDILAVDAALADFAKDHPEKANLIKLRFYVGLTIEQAAEAMGISVATAKRYWAYGRAWLFHELGKNS